MQIPLLITFRNLDRSQAMEASIREHAEKLDKFYDRIMSCRVVIEEQHKHHQHPCTEAPGRSSRHTVKNTPSRSGFCVP